MALLNECAHADWAALLSPGTLDTVPAENTHRAELKAIEQIGLGVKVGQRPVKAV